MADPRPSSSKSSPASEPSPTSEQHSAQAPPPTEGDGLAQEGATTPPSPGGEMSFLDHLEELRWSLFKGLGGLVLGVVVCVFFRGWILREVLLGPLRKDFFMYRALTLNAEEITLLNRTVTGQFFADLGTIVAAGAVIGSPILVYYLWKFVEPALYQHEKKGLRFAAAFASFFFFLGVAFGYLILTPLALQFFAQYQLSAQVVNEFDIIRYFNLLILWALGCGFLFELPVAVYFLTRLGVVTPQVLRTYRKYAFLVVLIVGAIFTPPDPVSQIIVALPLLLLYEGSIYIAVFTARRRRKRLRREGTTE